MIKNKKVPRITIEVDDNDEIAFKSGFITDLLQAIESINEKYYEELFSDPMDKYGYNYEYNQVEAVVYVKGKIAISKRYGRK